MSETSVGMRSTDENSNHSNKTIVLLVIFSLRMSRKFLKGSFSSTRKMLLIKKPTCQIFTKGKCVEDTLQFAEYLLCISGIKVIESIDTIRRHS